jgi:hypothetical protein
LKRFLLIASILTFIIGCGNPITPEINEEQIINDTISKIDTIYIIDTIKEFANIYINVYDSTDIVALVDTVYWLDTIEMSSTDSLLKVYKIRHIYNIDITHKIYKLQVEIKVINDSHYNTKCDAVQCYGTTKKGYRCKNRTTNCSGYCYLH